MFGTLIKCGGEKLSSCIWVGNDGNQVSTKILKQQFMEISYRATSKESEERNLKRNMQHIVGTNNY